ncbi:MAG: PBP1A family penicillin-binding protein [Proteobacteria bacterium]|nr:PBP1A family penicillin-binding protein [Pseudomonadota bacterium]
MRQIRTVSLSTRLKRVWLDANALVDSGLYGALRHFANTYANYSAFMDRFKVTGGKKATVFVLSEGLTWGTAGLALLLTLGLPAFREVDDENWLKKQDLAVTFYDRAGNEIGKRGIRHDDSLDLDSLPDHLIKATLATEDRRFYEHFGIDIPGLVRAIVVNARANSVVQGGSTLTQQLAKNLFLSNERSLERKIKEAFLALWLEARLTKREILKLYLDRAYMGNGIFGVQAAAQQYFGKNVKDLTLAESAMLAGLFKAPSRYAPHVNLPAARARAADVLGAMVDAGFMTEGQVAIARRNPASAIEQQRAFSPDYFLDFAFEEVKRVAEEGKFGNERVLRVKTTIDVALQKNTEQALETILRRDAPNYDVDQAAAVILEPDGAVKAMFGGRDYGASQFNRATHALRQPGSSFKPVVYAAALQHVEGMKPSTRVTDRPTCVGNWCVNNYSRSFAGTTDLATALARSYNTIPVQLTTAIGRGNNRAGRGLVIDMARRLGLGDLRDMTSLPIGSVEVTVADMAGAFAVFASGGKKARPYAALEIRNSRDQLIYQPARPEIRNEQILASSIAADMNQMLNKVTEEGTGRRALLPGVKTAGKTGTSDEYKNAWFVGYTGNYVGAVWFGNDDSTPTENMTGGSLPAQAWHDIMEFAHTDVDLRPLYGVETEGGTRSFQTVNAPRPAARPSADAAASRTASVRLSRRSAQVISNIESTMRSVSNRPGASLSPDLTPSVPGFTRLN